MTDNYDDYMFYEEDYDDISDWDESSYVDQSIPYPFESISLKNTTTKTNSSSTTQNTTINPTSTNCNHEINHAQSILSQTTNNKNVSTSIQHNQEINESIVIDNIETPNKSETVEMTPDVITTIHEEKIDIKMDKYGLSNEIVINLCKKKVNINTMIKFHGIKCSLFHAAIECFHSMKIPFSKFLLLHKPTIDIRDEYGRTALTLAVWNLSSSLTINNSKIVYALIEYGFNPFLKFRGLNIVDKLRKIKERHSKKQMQQSLNGRRSFSIKNNFNKSMIVIDEILWKISYHIRQLESIHIGLNNLIQKDILVYDLGKIITNYVGICHYDDYILPKTRKRNAELRINCDFVPLQSRINLF